MPIFAYQCHHCGLQFDKLWKTQSLAQEAGTTLECKSCGEMAEKMVSAANFGFNQAVTGPVPQNTGIHGIDSKFDQVIGRDAAAKWSVIAERQAAKKRVISNNDVTGHDLRRTSDNEYVVMPQTERGMSERARSLHSEALKRIETAKQSNSSEG